MLYPKKGNAPTEKRLNFNQQQKQELKRQVADRLVKKYGISYEDLIKQQINDNFDNASRISTQVIKNLEDRIEQNINRDQNPAEANQFIEDDQQSVKSGISKMSGATNFDKFDSFTQKSKTTSKNNKILNTQIVNKKDNDLGFLNEEGEWAAIYKYNQYLYKKEQEQQQNRLQEQKKRVQEDLQAQVTEKQRIKQDQLKMDQYYYDALDKQCQIFDLKEAAKAKALQDLKFQEKKEREKQIKDNKKRNIQQIKEEAELDKFLIQKVKEEIEKDKEFQQFKKQHQVEVQAQIKAENEIKQQILGEKAKQDKQETIDQINAYCKLIETQELEREKTLAERDDKIKESQKLALTTTVKQHEDNLLALEQRRLRYQERQDKVIDAEEKQKKDDKEKLKITTKEFLFKQMQEKKIREQAIKDEHQEQAKIWKLDNELYEQYEKEKQIKLQKVRQDYKDTLKNQIYQNSKKFQTNSKLNPEEMAFNKQVLEEIVRLEQQEA